MKIVVNQVNQCLLIVFLYSRYVLFKWECLLTKIKDKTFHPSVCMWWAMPLHTNQSTKLCNYLNKMGWCRLLVYGDIGVSITQSTPSLFLTPRQTVLNCSCSCLTNLSPLKIVTRIIMCKSYYFMSVSSLGLEQHDLKTAMLIFTICSWLACACMMVYVECVLQIHPALQVCKQMVCYVVLFHFQYWNEHFGINYCSPSVDLFNSIDHIYCFHYLLSYLLVVLWHS